MPIQIGGKQFHYMGEALKLIGISRTTFHRWLKTGKIEDVKHRDRNKRRLFTAKDIQRIKNYAETITTM